jgi:hypothetical protein
MDKDQYQEPEVAYEADEGITALASAVRDFCCVLVSSDLTYKHNVLHVFGLRRLRMNTGYPEAKTQKSGVTLMGNPTFMD